MQSLGSIPADLPLGTVWEVDLGTTMPAAVIGRRSQYDELIWDADGGFAGSWIAGSSVSGNGTDGYTMVLKRTAYSGAGLALFAAGASSGGGTGDFVGPGSAVDGDFVAFDGVTGKLGKDSGKNASDFATPASVTSGDASTLAAAKAYTDTHGGGDPALGGDLSGTASAATVEKIQGVDVNVSGAVDGQVLGFVGGGLAPVNQSGGGGSGGWQTVLDVNLHEDANFSFVDGAFTWKGLPWVGRNIAAGADSFGVVNGSGIVLNLNGTNTVWYGPGGNDNAPVISCFLADLIPGFQPFVTRVRVTAMISCNASANYESMAVKIENLRAGVGSSAYSSDILQAYDTSGDLGGIAAKSGYVGRTYGAGRYCVACPATDTLLCMDWTHSHATYFGYTPAAAASDPNDNAMVIANYLTRGWTLRSQSSAPATQAPSTVTEPYVGSSPRDLRLSLGGWSGNTNNSFVGTISRLRVEYIL